MRRRTESCGVSLSAVTRKNVFSDKPHCVAIVLLFFLYLKNLRKQTLPSTFFIIPHSEKLCIDFTRNIWYNVRSGGEVYDKNSNCG